MSFVVVADVVVGVVVDVVVVVFVVVFACARDQGSFPGWTPLF